MDSEELSTELLFYKCNESEMPWPLNEIYSRLKHSEASIISSFYSCLILMYVTVSVKSLGFHSYSKFLAFGLKIYLVLLNYLILNLTLIQFKSKFESRALAFFRFHLNFTSKLGNNLIWYIKSQTNSVFIHLIWVLDIAEKSKQLVSVLIFNSDTSINHLYF